MQDLMYSASRITMQHLGPGCMQLSAKLHVYNLIGSLCQQVTTNNIIQRIVLPYCFETHSVLDPTEE